MEKCALTENGDKAFSTSGNVCLDFFTRITRNAAISDYIDAFTKGWKEDKNTMFQILMNLRDVRDGKGEKLIPAVIMVYLKFTIPANVYETILRQMILYGCWKDLLRIMEIETRTYMERSKKSVIEECSIEAKLFAEQLKKDNDALLEETQNPGKKVAISLCAKWAPSENTHYDHHPIFATTQIRKAMGIEPKQYRLMLTKLRRHIGVLEMLMSTQRYDEIDFSKLPSIALMKMNNAFSRNTNASGIESEARKKLYQSYSKYLRKLAEGKTKVNIKGIQPHELIRTYMNNINNGIDSLVEEQWKALKKSIMDTGVFRNVTAIVDVSASMTGQPIEVAIALGILVAECTMGPFHGKCITFHEKPSWHNLVGETLIEQVSCMVNAPWGGSTDLRKVFDMILREAKRAELKPEEMVKTLFIFTDMQFNQCSVGYCESTFEYSKKQFENSGYKLPFIVCWNLRTSTNKIIPIENNNEGIIMLSGFSSELLKYVLTAQELTALSMMMHILEPYKVPMEVDTCNVVELQPTTNLLIELDAAVQKSSVKKAFKSNIKHHSNIKLKK